MGIKGVEELEEAVLKMQDFTPIKYETKNKEDLKIIKIIEQFIEKI